ncbi:MAG: hypothetical protein MRZ28_05010 [Oscillospiraceae bacterium]|nr:hypothetical protein [Oscillospiraceae bacterium]MDY3218280.1 hypothetical protein [Candidatus Fimivivens sp.]
MLIDTPGLDSGSDEYRKDGLAHSLAYLLIFPADESVVKESAAAVLAELKLRDAPVYGVLTKCDKVPPEEVGNSMRYLQGQLERLLGRPSVPLVCASTRTPGGTSRVETLLLGFQERADEIARRRFTAQLLDRGRSLARILSMRITYEELSVSELTGRIEALQAEIEEILSRLALEEKEFLAHTAQCRTLLLERANERLDEACEPIERMLSTGQSPAAYVEGMLRGGVTADMLAHFEPAARLYIRQTVGILEVQSSEARPGGAVEQLRRFADIVRQPRSILGKTEAIGEISSLFGNKLPEQHGLWRGRQRQALLQKKVRKEFIPCLHRAVSKYIDSLISRRTEWVRSSVRDALEEEFAASRRALEDAYFRKARDDSRRSDGGKRMRRDLDTLKDLLRGFGEKQEAVL